MNSDPMEFDNYTKRMYLISLLWTAAGTAVLFPWGISLWGAWLLGTLFNVLFFFLLNRLYTLWQRNHCNALWTAQHIALLGFLRLPIEAIGCFLIVWATSFHVFFFLAGLLSLRVSIYMESLCRVIRK